MYLWPAGYLRDWLVCCHTGFMLLLVLVLVLVLLLLLRRV
jgi:hypothetical protein